MRWSLVKGQAIARRALGLFLQTEDGAHPDNRIGDEGASVVTDERIVHANP